MRKTFTTKEEARHYTNKQTEKGNVAVLGSLGDKFRVYVETEAEIEQSQSWRSKPYTKKDSERYLRRIAGEAMDAIGDALALKKSMESGDVYNDYEEGIAVARILENYKALKYASDVFNFLDHPSRYEKVMKQIIEETLEEYDYEGKEETAKV